MPAGRARLHLFQLRLHTIDDLESVFTSTHDDDARDSLTDTIQIGNATP